MDVSAGSVAAVIPAKDEAARIAATVAAAAAIPGVDLVVVVDDGSADDTADLARAAGAVVVRHPRNRGKAAAMTTGARGWWRCTTTPLPAATGRPRHLLFVDGDLEASAAGTRRARAAGARRAGRHDDRDPAAAADAGWWARASSSRLARGGIAAAHRLARRRSRCRGCAA